jgi:hypothetical protein
VLATVGVAMIASIWRALRLKMVVTDDVLIAVNYFRTNRVAWHEIHELYWGSLLLLVQPVRVVRVRASGKDFPVEATVNMRKETALISHLAQVAAAQGKTVSLLT